VIRVCIAGITGWVGGPLAQALRESDDMELVAGVARSSAGETIDGVPVFAGVEAALAVPFDVMVDYTSAHSVAANVLAAVRGDRHVVVGSSGMTDADYETVDAVARERGKGVIAGGNFSLSAALLQRFAVEAAKYFPQAEVVDLAYIGKIDAPSGTARELSWRLAQVTGAPPPVHSVRLPGYTIGVEGALRRRERAPHAAVRWRSGRRAVHRGHPARRPPRRRRARRRPRVRYAPVIDRRDR